MRLIDWQSPSAASCTWKWYVFVCVSVRKMGETEIRIEYTRVLGDGRGVRRSRFVKGEIERQTDTVHVRVCAYVCVYRCL